MSRKPMMAGNWKMNKTPAEAVVLAQSISNNYNDTYDNVDVVLCPPAIDLRSVVTVLDFDKSDIALGAQNVHWEESGAFTGETSIPMLRDVGAQYCIIGHSERREMFGETDDMVRLKAQALVAAKMTPIICVGESLAVRESGKAQGFVCDQVRAALAGMSADEVKRTVIAYEPIWAIGTGQTATTEQAEAMCAAIRATLAELSDAETAESVRVLYGGSCNPGNVDALMACENIDGGLIGGASLKAEDFIALVQSASASVK